VYLVVLLAAGAILGGVVVVAMGRGGEMALFDRDLPVKITRLQTPGEVASLQLPFGLIGYQAGATGEALVAVANLLARRDAEIAALRGELGRLGGGDQAAQPFAPPSLAPPSFAGPSFAGPSFAGPSFAAPSFAGQSFDVPSFGAPSAGSPPAGEAGDPSEEAPVASDLDHDEAGWNGQAGWEDGDASEDRAGEHEQTGQSDEASQADQVNRP
jgi:hypothetical protein